MLQSSPNTAISPHDTEEFYAQLNRILNSITFREAPSSRRLLEYIATCSLQNRGEDLKEFTIGVEALGRRTDFDPKTDTIVRVQVRRVRQKISHYYKTEGVHDPVLLTIPRGGYIAEFSWINANFAQALESEFHDVSWMATPIALPAREKHSESFLAVNASNDENGRRNSLYATWRAGRHIALLILTAALCGALAEYWIAHQLQYSKNASPVSKLWSAMLSGDSSPIIGYPDAIFLVDEFSDLFQFTEGPVGARGELVDPNVALKFAPNSSLIAKAGPLYYENGGYTGAGEVESVATLTRLLHDLGFHPKLKRSHEITADDLRTHNVILLGGSAQNRAVRDFQVPASFKYHYKPGDWSGEMINLHPSVGEASSYHVERNPGTHGLEADYALVSCLPSIDASHRIITLGGLDTTGTLGATNYITSNAGAEDLEKVLLGHEQRPYFQAIIRVVLKNGQEILRTQPVAVRGSSSDTRSIHSQSENTHE